MKIGIACYPTHGGSGVVASELAIGLAERDHEVHIVSYATPFRLGGYHEKIFIHEVDMVSYPLFKYPAYGLALATKLVDVAREYQLDILHSHYAVPHAASAYLAKQILGDTHLKTVTTLHGTDITLVGQDRSFYEVVRFAIEHSDAVTAVSEYLKKQTYEAFDVRKEIQVIYNFVDVERYRPDAVRCYRGHFAPHGERILIHASNFRPVKRVGDTVRLLALLRKKVPAKLLLIGEGPERMPAQQLVRELGVGEDVIFLGQQDYVESVLACGDLFLLPSEQESFGLAALEANACGVPVLGSNIGGIPELVKDGETGYLFPVGDVDAMCEKALQILSDDEVLRGFRIRARGIAIEKFQKTEIVPQYERLYESLLA